MTTVKAIPDGMHAITPHLICSDASAAIAFYVNAFGAVEEGRMATANGKIMHASLRLGGSLIFLFDEMPEYGALSPLALNGSPVTIHYQVADVDAMFARAVAAGATVTMPIADMFWGDRYGKVRDPFGHHWSIATHVRDLSPDQIQQAFAALPPMATCE